MPTAGTSDKVPLPPPPADGPLAALLSYLVPGLGQIYQGRVGKGFVFFFCIYFLFFYGQWLGRGEAAITPDKAKTYTVLSNVYLPDSAEANDPWNLAPKGANADPNKWSFGRLLANLYNRPHFAGQFWVGVGAWPAVYQYLTYKPDDDLQPPLAGFQRAPPEAILISLQTAGDKTWDLAWVYTVIAGVLNLMVIYDAFAGPAFVPRPAKPTPDGKAPHGPAPA